MVRRCELRYAQERSRRWQARTTFQASRSKALPIIKLGTPSDRLVLFHPGMASVFNPKRLEVTEMLTAGAEVWSVDNPEFAKANSLNQRALLELLIFQRIKERRRLLLSAAATEIESRCAAGGKKPMVTVVAHSFAMTYLTRLAHDIPQLFDPIERIVAIAPSFDKESMPRFYRRWTLGGRLQESTCLMVSLSQVLQERGISLFFMVPEDDDRVDVEQTEYVYRCLRGVDKTAIFLGQAKHYPFNDETPRPVRHFAIDALQAIIAHKSIPNIPESLRERIQVLHGDSEWV